MWRQVVSQQVMVLAPLRAKLKPKVLNCCSASNRLWLRSKLKKMSLSRLCWALTTILLANSAASISSQLSKNLLRRNSTELAAADLTSACQVSQWWCKQMRRLNLLVTTKMTKTKMRHKLATRSNSQWVQPLKRARILRETIKSQLRKESIELLQWAKWAEKSLRLKLRDVSTDYQLALDRFGPKKRSPDDLLVCKFWPKVCLPL